MTLHKDLGVAGASALLLIAATVAFSLAVVDPLEKRAGRLQRETQPERNDYLRVSTQPAADQLAAFYRFFDRPERVEDWLAKLYGSATAAGLELRTADYRLTETRHRMERYSITLPLSGSYAQVRTFLEAALVEMPVLSLDQVTFRRKASNEARLEAEVALTLHLPRPAAK